MQILSVNVGDRRPVKVKQRNMQTGIYKTPAAGSVKVSRLGLKDDVRIEHRKMGLEHSAVYAYPYEHYAYWQTELKSERNSEEPFPLGQFGENLTVTGLLEKEVRIGDIFRFGNTILQVAHPRIPCGKLNARMGFRFAPMFLASCKVGYYMRVIKEGSVAKGDSIELLERDENSPTMEEFVRVTHYEYWDELALKKLLQARDLMPFWREMIESKIVRNQLASGWQGLREFEIVHRVQESEDTVSLDLKCVRGRALSPFHGGQQLMVALGERGGGSQKRKAFYLSSSPQTLSTYRIIVRHGIEDAQDCAVSSHLSTLKEGNHIRSNAPFGAVRSLPEKNLGEERIRVLISQGLGIAPILSILYEFEEIQPRVILFHESDTNEPQELLTEVNELVSRNSNFEMIRADSSKLEYITAEQICLHGALAQFDIDVAGSCEFIDRLVNEFMALDFAPAALMTRYVD